MEGFHGPFFMIEDSQVSIIKTKRSNGKIMYCVDFIKLLKPITEEEIESRGGIKPIPDLFPGGWDAGPALDWTRLAEMCHVNARTRVRFDRPNQVNPPNLIGAYRPMFMDMDQFEEEADPHSQRSLGMNLERAWASGIRQEFYVHGTITGRTTS